MLKRPVILFASLLFAAVLVFGLIRLFDLRFDRGDIYPPYSTLRADPLGASMLYEGLDQVPGVTVQRYFEETFKTDDGQGHALFVLGTEPGSFTGLSRTEFNTLQRFVFNGGRVVIAYYPAINESRSSSFTETNATDDPVPDGKRSRHAAHKKKPVAKVDENGGETNIVSGAGGSVSTNAIHSTNGIATDLREHPGETVRHAHKSRRPEKTSDDQDDDDFKAEQLKYADLPQEWGFSYEYKNLETNDDGEVEFPSASLMVSNLDLPSHLAIHTSMCFTGLTNGWTVIYQRDKTKPVVIERKFGAGAVVLVADSYPFSNEAMFKDRSASLMSWMLGDGHDAIFEEAHLGIVEEPGVATLMRRYQLHGLIFGLLIVAGLFVWKNSISLVPPHAEAGAGAGLVVAGRDSASGFVNLVRRGIAPGEIINVCFAEWKKSGARVAAISATQRRDLEQLIQQQAAVEPHLRKPVENYRVISQILKRRK